MEKIYLAPQVLTESKNNTQMPLPPPLEKENIQWRHLKSGIQLVTMDYTPDLPIVLEYVPPFNPLGFAFYLSGRCRVQAAGQKKSTDIGPGQAVFNCFPGLPGLTETIGTERVRRVAIMMDLDRFYAFAQGELNGLPPQFEDLSTKICHHNSSITPAMHHTIFQIFNCPYQGWTKSFFLESKALELVAHKLGQIEAAASRKPYASHLPLSDADRIREAASLLTGDLEKSPDLNQLARSVGMCRSKLHRCFRMVYGITPFEYLRNRRLETAMAFLADGQMNVTEAAYAVGYSSPSYFTKAFKKYFGHLPGNSSQQHLYAKPPPQPRIS